MLCDALLAAFPGAREHIEAGEARRGLAHSAAGYATPERRSAPDRLE